MFCERAGASRFLASSSCFPSWHSLACQDFSAAVASRTLRWGASDGQLHSEGISSKSLVSCLFYVDRTVSHPRHSYRILSTSLARGLYYIARTSFLPRQSYDIISISLAHQRSV